MPAREAAARATRHLRRDGEPRPPCSPHMLYTCLQPAVPHAKACRATCYSLQPHVLQPATICNRPRHVWLQLGHLWLQPGHLLWLQLGHLLWLQPGHLLWLQASLGVQPDAWAYSAAMNAFAQTGRPTQAIELFHAMPHQVPPHRQPPLSEPSPSPSPSPSPYP